MSSCVISTAEELSHARHATRMRAGRQRNKTPCLFCEPTVFGLPFHHCLSPGPYWPSLTWTPEKYVTCSPALLSPFFIRPLITALPTWHRAAYLEVTPILSRLLETLPWSLLPTEEGSDGRHLFPSPYTLSAPGKWSRFSDEPHDCPCL